jgi:hypothetical protein
MQLLYGAGGGGAMNSALSLRRQLLIAVAAISAYWIGWYTSRGTVASVHSQSYTDFVNAFPVADAVAAAALLLGALALKPLRPSALLWLLVGGGAAAFLCAIDVLYDVEHGIWVSGASGLAEAAINVATAYVSVRCVTWAWARRNLLLAHPAEDVS